jgi:DNA-binding CsgD family transcriptional regulator
MFMIGSEQWYKINELVRKLFRVRDLAELQRVFLDDIWFLVPYDQAMFYLVREYQGRLVLLSPHTINVTASFAEMYEQMRFEESIMVDAALPLTMVRPLQRLDDHLIPSGMEHGARAIVAGKMHAVAEVTFFRAKAGGSFTENEMEILKVLADHLEACMKGDPLYVDGRAQNHEMQLRQELRYMTLTEAEIEIAVLAAGGLTNAQICELKRIAPTTVKKHLSRIYQKMGVVGKGQMLYEITKMMREM